ncbi:hypothetical protein NB16F81_50900 [Escherichia coli]
MLDTQELAPVAIALLLSVIGGIGTFLMDVRDGRQSGNLLGLVTEIFVAVTAGAVAYLLGQHEGWELSITYLMVTMNRPGFPGECFICELRLPDHRF